MSVKISKKHLLFTVTAITCLAGGCISRKDVPPDIPVAESYSENTAGSEEGFPVSTAYEEDEPNWPEPIDYTALPSGTVIEEELSSEDIDDLFYAQEISDKILARIDGVSYVKNNDISLSDLRYLRLLYTGFDEKTHIGELIVNVSISDTVLKIFRTLYDNQYQIEKMVLVDEYDGDDHASMLDNNTSSFNYRVVEGSTRLSRHAYGLAIDINPFYNPYITYENGHEHISPEGSELYRDRESDFPHKIARDSDLCWQLFDEYGFTWGGDWNSVKDYQHFQFSQ